MIRESICGLFPPRGVVRGGIWDGLGRNMFGKNYDFSEHVFGQEWARRGSSGHETSSKLIAIAFSSLHCPMVRDPTNQTKTKDPNKTIPINRPQAADML